MVMDSSLCNLRIQPEKIDDHLNEMHSTLRIYCPLKFCIYVAKQMTKIRTYWNGELAVPVQRNAISRA